MSFHQKLEQIVARYELIEQKLLNFVELSPADFAKLSKERTEIGELSGYAKSYIRLLHEIDSLQKLMDDADTEQELRDMAKSELRSLREQGEVLYSKLRKMFIPKDKDDDKNVILEIRAGTGGEEAALFSAALLRMYRRYAEKRKWSFEILSITETGLEGCKEVSVNVTGEGVFARLKFESGVHRVQRVPETEASGRIHTSAATVAILPEPEEIEIQLNDKDLRIDVYRSGGAGGQHVNTTDSAVRITHLPTGIVVCQQDEKSQHKNKAKALKILRSRIYDVCKSQQTAHLSEMRRGQIGSGDRSERIRTYNFPQNRLSDHRINLTLYSLDRIINEGELDELIDALITDDQSKKLACET